SFTCTSHTAIYTLSLHDALPICARELRPSEEPIVRERADDVRHDERCHDQQIHEGLAPEAVADIAKGSGHDEQHREGHGAQRDQDRKSTRLNSSHVSISYAVFCL